MTALDLNGVIGGGGPAARGRPVQAAVGGDFPSGVVGPGTRPGGAVEAGVRRALSGGEGTARLAPGVDGADGVSLRAAGGGIGVTQAGVGNAIGRGVDRGDLVAHIRGEGQAGAAVDGVGGWDFASAAGIGRNQVPGQGHARTVELGRGGGGRGRGFDLGLFEQDHAPGRVDRDGNGAAGHGIGIPLDHVQQDRTIRQIVGRVIQTIERHRMGNAVPVEQDDGRLAGVSTGEAVELVGVVNHDPVLHVAVLQDAGAAADAGHLAHEVLQAGVGGEVAGGVVPGEGGAVVGVVFVLAAAEHAVLAQAHFVAVVQGRRAGVGEGEQPQLLHALDGGGIVIVVDLLQQEAQPVGVVRAAQVHHRLPGRRGVILLDRTQAGIQLGWGNVGNRAARTARIAVVVLEDRPTGAAVAAAPGEEPAQDRRAIAVIHHAVPFVTQQPGRGVAPFFAEGDRRGVHASDGGAEALPVIVGRIVGQARVHVPADVEAPPGGPLPDPIRTDGTAPVIPNQTPHCGAVGLQLWQR